MIAAALPLAFLVNIVAAPTQVRLVGSFSVVILMVVFAQIVKVLAPKQSRFLTFAMSAAISARLLYSIPVVMHAADRMAFRVAYLHWVFLAIISVGLWEASGDRRMSSAIAWTSVPLILGILPFTGLWGYAAGAANTVLGVSALELTHAARVLTILTSLGPPVVGLYWLGKTRRSSCH